MQRETELYLSDILESIENIQKYTSGFTYEDFISNRMCVDAVIRNFLTIGEVVKKYRMIYCANTLLLNRKISQGYGMCSFMHTFG